MKTFILLVLLSLFTGSCGNDEVPTPINPTPPITEEGPLGYSTGYIKDPHSRLGVKYWRPKRVMTAIPDSWDWREHGGIIPIHDQGSCGSCWADSSVHNLVASEKIFNKKDIALSVQEVVSYDKDYYGCSGGMFPGRFFKKYGVALESDCPYRASNNPGSACKSDILRLGVSFIEDYIAIGGSGRSPTPDEIMEAVHKYGYVTATVGAGGGWGSYKSGIFKGCRGTGTNHMVLIVGYDKNKKTWVIQNSWGVDWGNKGYMELPWDCDHIAEDAWVPILKNVIPCVPPKAMLPVKTEVRIGDDLILAVKLEAGMEYSWFLDKQLIGTGPMITITPVKDAVYTLTAKNNCGVSEISTLVQIRE